MPQTKTELIKRYDHLENILNNRVSMGPSRDPWPIAREMVELLEKLEKLEAKK
jgi:hypothetical protein